VLVNVNNTRRWVPAHIASREALRTGSIGPLSQRKARKTVALIEAVLISQATGNGRVAVR
jgi:hypothetical protein